MKITYFFSEITQLPQDNLFPYFTITRYPAVCPPNSGA